MQPASGIATYQRFQWVTLDAGGRFARLKSVPFV